MLRNVIGDYLDRLAKERDLDAPLLALMGAMSLKDLNLTHGITEKGKDFIAKSEDRSEQWVIQSKRGRITLKDWRDEIQSQLMECATTNLQHPAFDRDMPRRIILATTGSIDAPVNDRLRDFADRVAPLNVVAVEAWGKEKLVELLLEWGLAGLHRNRVVDIEAQGRFFSIYGAAVRGELVIRDLEEHSTTWLDKAIPAAEMLLVGAIEAGILSAVCRCNAQLYEALQCQLAALRMTLCNLWRALGSEAEHPITTLYEAQLQSVMESAREFVSAEWESWERAERQYDRCIQSGAAFATYPVACSRLIEAMGLLAMNNTPEAADVAVKLEEFAGSEPGAAHPISDRYTASIIAATLALLKHGKVDAAEALVTASTVWVCDLIEKAFGMADVDATVDEEIQRYLGWPFDCFDLVKERDCICATALADLSAQISPALYSNVVNDLKAVEAFPQYYQAADDEAQFFIEGETIRLYPNIAFEDQLGEDGAAYADHIRNEPPGFRLMAHLGFIGFACIMLFLRDRWFVSLWRSFLNGSNDQPAQLAGNC